MLEENKRVRSKIPAAFEALMGLHLAKVDDVIEPGLTTLSWSSTQIHDYIACVYHALGKLELLMDRVHECTEFRIDAILRTMATTSLCELPEDEPWTVDQFLENTQVRGECPWEYNLHNWLLLETVKRKTKGWKHNSMIQFCIKVKE